LAISKQHGVAVEKEQPVEAIRERRRKAALGSDMEFRKVQKKKGLKKKKKDPPRHAFKQQGNCTKTKVSAPA